MERSRPRWRITLAGWPVVWVAFSIFGASFVHRVNLLLLVFALMISAVLVSARMGRRQIRFLRLSRKAPSLVPAGQPFTTTVEVWNDDPHRLAMGIALREKKTSGKRFGPSETRLDDIPVGGMQRVPLVRTFERRGEYTLGPIALATRFPLGLVEWRTEPPLPENRVVVHPAIGELLWAGRQRLGMQGHGEGQAISAWMDGIEEFRGVRDYRPGDSPRLVHWRSTARRGSLVVRELDPTAGRGILLVAFLVPPSTNRASAETGPLEAVLSFVATVVAEVAHDPTLTLTLLVVGKNPQVVRGQASAHRTPAYLRALATAEPTLSEEDLHRARRLLQPGDLRDRRYWVVSLAGTSPSGSPAWPAELGRRLSSPILLNASAGDLDALWHPTKADPPNLSNRSER